MVKHWIWDIWFVSFYLFLFVRRPLLQVDLEETTIRHTHWSSHVKWRPIQWWEDQQFFDDSFGMCVVPASLVLYLKVFLYKASGFLVPRWENMQNHMEFTSNIFRMKRRNLDMSQKLQVRAKPSRKQHPFLLHATLIK